MSVADITYPFECSICGAGARRYRRCDEHYRCDTCKATEKLLYTKDGLFCLGCRQAYIEKLVSDFDGRTELTSSPICPHCGEVFTHWRDLDWRHSTTKEVDCGRCDREFSIEVIINYDFTTRKT